MCELMADACIAGSDKPEVTEAEMAAEQLPAEEAPVEAAPRLSRLLPPSKLPVTLPRPEPLSGAGIPYHRYQLETEGNTHG